MPCSVTWLALCSVELRSAEQGKNKIESWHTYWDWGFSDASYADKVAAALEAVENLPEFDHASVGLDLLGFYCDRYEVGSAQTH